MDWLDFSINQNNIGILIGTLGSAWAAWLTFKNKQGVNVVNKFELLLESESKLIATLCSEMENLKKELFESQKEINGLNILLLTEREKLIHLNHLVNSQFNSIKALQKFCEYIPTPTWLKKPPNLEAGEEYSRMLFINQAYEEQWHISKQSYINKTDIELWPKVVADLFAVNDLEVANKCISIITKELVPLKPFEKSNNSEMKEWLIWKFPVMIDDTITVGGIAIDLENKNFKQNYILPPRGE